MASTHKLNKPVFVGEFGAPHETPEQAAKCRRLLKAIIDHDSTFRIVGFRSPAAEGLQRHSRQRPHMAT